MPKARDPLQFAYVRIKMQEDTTFKPNIFKVFWVDDHKIRIRTIRWEKGKEIEGVNTWIPWVAIDVLEEMGERACKEYAERVALVSNICLQ